MAQRSFARDPKRIQLLGCISINKGFVAFYLLFGFFSVRISWGAGVVSMWVLMLCPYLLVPEGSMKHILILTFYRFSLRWGFSSLCLQDMANPKVPQFQINLQEVMHRCNWWPQGLVWREKSRRKSRLQCWTFRWKASYFSKTNILSIRPSQILQNPRLEKDQTMITASVHSSRKHCPRKKSHLPVQRYLFLSSFLGWC